MRLNRSDRSDRRTTTATATSAGCIGDPMPRIAPAGSLTSGVPAATWGAGTFSFRTSVLVLGVEPTLDPGGFQARLQNALSQLVPGVSTSRAVLSKGSETTAKVPRIASGPLRVANAVLPDRDVQAWWIAVEGQVTAQSGFSLNGTNGLNRAIARAIAQSISFRGFTDADFRSKIPTDGGSLDAQFRSGAACSGGFNPQQVYARACTRLEAVGPNALATQPGPTQQPGPTAAPPAPSSATPELQGTRTCAVRLQAKMFLRPTATFATKDAQGRNFPEIPAGTAVTITGERVGVQGNLALYPVSVAGRTGYGALNAQDFVGCTTFTAPPGSTAGGSTNTTLAPRPNTTPAPPAPAPLPQMVLRSNAGSSTLLYAGGATLAVLAIGGAVYYATRKKRNRKPGRKHRARR